MFYDDGIDPSTAISAPPTINYQIAAAGQSWVSGFRNQYAYAAFQNYLLGAIASPGSDNVFLNLAEYGGSAVLQSNAPASPANWWFVSGVGTFSRGPLATSARSLISGKLARGPTPICGIWYQQQGDTGAVDMTSYSAAVSEAVLHRQATTWLLNDFATLWNPGTPTDVKWFVDLEGRRRESGYARRIAVMRDSRLAMIAANANLRFGMETYDVPLPLDNDHPYGLDWGHFGLRTAVAIANEYFGGTVPLGPTIGTITRPTPTTISIPIVPGAGRTIVKPASPIGFGLFDANDLVSGTRITPSAYSWAGDTLTLTVPAQNLLLTYPYIDGSDEWSYLPGGTDDRIIRYVEKVATGDPTGRFTDIGFPLRSFASQWITV